MAFNLDFAHIPSGIELPTLPSVDSGVSSTSKSIMDKMTSDPGSLFSNPMVNATNVLGDSVTRIETSLTNLADGTITSPAISQSEASAFLALDPLQDIRTSMGNFLMHTNRLSGVLKSQGIQAPGLQQIMSIGMQMQNMMTLLEAGKGCLPIVGGATGLFSSDTFAGYTNQLENLLSRLERGAATIADIADLIGTISNLIRGIMDKDSQFLQNCVNQLQSAAVALALEALDRDPCAHFVLNTISNKNPGGIMNILAKPIL